MTPTIRILRRIFLLPIAAADDRDVRLNETRMRTESAQRVHTNAVTAWSKSASTINALTGDVIRRNEPKEDPE